MPQEQNTPCICGKYDCIIPYGTCHCGCGSKTSIAPHNHKKSGWIKGEPLRYARGHFHSKGHKHVCAFHLNCKRCGKDAIGTAPRQKYCSRECQQADHKEKTPPRKRIWGKPEYYKRKELDKNGLKQCKDCKGIFLLDEYWNVGKSKKGTQIKSARCTKCADKRQKKLRKHYPRTEKDRVRHREWKVKNPDTVKRGRLRYDQKHPERAVNKRHIRRVRVTKNGVYRVSTNDLRQLFIRQSGCCYLCGLAIVGKKHLDHIIPVARGGRHSIGNLGWTHQKCNQLKGTKFLVEVRYDRRKKVQPGPNLDTQLSGSDKAVYGVAA